MVWEALRGEPQTVAQLEASTELEGPNLLRDLCDRKLDAADGGAGRRTTYRRIPE